MGVEKNQDLRACSSHRKPFELFLPRSPPREQHEGIEVSTSEKLVTSRNDCAGHVLPTPLQLGNDLARCHRWAKLGAYA